MKGLKKRPLRAGRQSHGRGYNIHRYSGNYKRDRDFLVRMLNNGRPPAQGHNFTDRRLKIIYGCLEWFQIQTPYRNADLFVDHMRGEPSLEFAGGIGFVGRVFAGRGYA